MSNQLEHTSCGFSTTAADGLFGGFAIATLTPGGPAHVGGMVHVGDVITEVRMGLLSESLSISLSLSLQTSLHPSLFFAIITPPKNS